MKYDTIYEAARAWVDEFSVVPRGIVEKLVERNTEEFEEVTPPAVGDRVYVWTNELPGEYGEIIRIKRSDYGGSTFYRIKLDNGDSEIDLSEDEFQVERESYFPMWNDM